MLKQAVYRFKEGKMSLDRQRKGFSLVELSIVLVILGLLVGGIMTGQNLIRAAELRAVTGEYDKYTTAVNIFRDKYFALPGDMANATKFWSPATNCPGTTTQGTTDGTTCDGNGDGRISFSTPTSNEAYRSWQHLANAGLVEGTYNGVTGPGNGMYNSLIGINVPASKLSPAGWSLFYRGNQTGDASLFGMEYGNAFIFGAATPTTVTDAAIFSPEEMWNIDTKIDDGKPGQGRVIAFRHNACTNSGGDPTALDADYQLSVSSTECAMFIRHVF